MPLLPDSQYKCPKCDLPVQKNRVRSMKTSGDGRSRVLIEHYCPCSVAILTSAFHPSVQAMRNLLGPAFKLPYDATPLTNTEIDHEVELFAFDLDGINNVAEFDWMCRVKKGH